MGNTKNTGKSNQSANRFADGILNFLFMYIHIFKEGVRSRAWKKKENILLLLGFMMATSSIIYRDHHILVAKYFTFDLLHQSIVQLSTRIGLPLELGINGFLCILFGFFLIGVVPYKIKRKYQKGIDRLRLKSGLDEKPVVLNVKHIDENRTKLLIKSYGLGQERYQSKLDDLRASVGQKVESVVYVENDNTQVEIFLARRPLENLVKLSHVKEYLTRPYSFIVGKSLKGVITQSIVDLPHLMIGGTSGGGKSVALNNVLINLLDSSDNLQMYLVDLKGGLEIKAYEGLENVTLIKNIQNTTAVLKQLVDEMNRRYQYLEENEFKKIDPKRDKVNRIVIAIDECTDLLGTIPRNHKDYTYVQKAIQYCDELARKSRASGIHIILATQKIDKSSIPTRIQENMAGRLALRVKTMENSIRLTGNRLAYDLPAVPGRSIWSIDSDFHEVQIPFSSDEQIKENIEKLKVQLVDGTKKNFGFKLKTTSKTKELRKDTKSWDDIPVVDGTDEVTTGDE
jgi:hypothetical protein